MSERVVMVTGGGGGMGAACVRRFAKSGAHVAVTDVDGDAARAVASEVGGGAIAFGLDVTDAAAVERTLDAIEAALGPVDAFVHVAGVFGSWPLLETTDEDIERILAVNVGGTFRCLRAVGRRMAARGSGAIVTVASQSSQVVRRDQGAYGASKAAASYLTKALGLELAERGVRCNVVHPGVTDTPMARAVWATGKGSPEAHIQGNLARSRVGIPLRKVGTADDIAGAVFFLASDEASHVTMQDIVVDGGASLIA